MKMKTERICISKKNLIISLIAVFLLGVVGVSYMVQKNISVKSRADERDAAYGDCDTAFLSLAKDFIIKAGKLQEYSKFSGDYIIREGSKDITIPRFCPFFQTHPYAESNTGRCCLKEEANGTSIDTALQSIGVEYDSSGVEITSMSGIPPTPFKSVIVDAKASINTVANMNNASTCVNYDAPKFTQEGKPSKEREPQACNTGDIREEECGPNGDNRRYFKVNCGSATGPEGKSCDFKCYNGKDWVTCKDDKSNYLPSVCLVPSPIPTKPPTANTFNSTNQTSNQSGAEDNLNCSQNLKQQDGSVLDTGYYKCYVATELLSGTSINRDGDISPAPTKINNRPVVYEANDGTMKLPRYVSTFYGRGKNEPCKKLVAGVSTNGVCASKK